MNTKLYWKIRSLCKYIVFGIKKLLYLIRRKYEKEKQTKYFSLLILKTIVLKLATACIVCVVFFQIDKHILYVTEESPLDNKMFLDIIIGGIGVAGVILGLYCSNMVSIFSSKYTNAPESISKLYQQDILTNKCIKQIVEYITICIALLVVFIAEFDLYYATVCLLLFLYTRTIITFSIAGNRAYDFSNTYRIATLVYPDIISTIKRLSKRKGIYSDNNFQDHYKKLCSNQLDVLYDIATYNESNSNNQTAPIISFLDSNIETLFFYLEHKASIHYGSYWYSDKTIYQQWHIASDVETSIYVRYGKMLDPKTEKDYSWFEKKIEDINNVSLEVLIKSSDYKSIYSFLVLLGNIPNEIVQKNTLDYWTKYILSLKTKILPIITETKDTLEVNSEIVGLSDAYALLLFNTMMNICNYIDKLNITQELSYATAIDKYSNVNFQKAVYLNSKRLEDFYKVIEVETKLEKSRITPNWYIEQFVSKEIYNHIIYLSKQLLFLYKEASKIGEFLLENKYYYSSAIWFSRLSELSSQIYTNKIFNKFDNLEKELLSKKKDSKVKWDDPCVRQSIERMQKHFSQTIHYLKECSSIFALTHNSNRTMFPDLLGYCYNLICDSLVSAITKNDYDTFNALYDGFLETVILYQEYVRQDLINPINNYNSEVIFSVYASPIIEFSIISGLAILWGEFIKAPEWCKVIEDELSPYRDESNTSKHSVLLKIISIVQNKKTIISGIQNRNLIQTTWEQTVSTAIKDLPNYKEIYNKHFDKYIDSKSKIFTVFLKYHFADFEILKDTEELFLILCINPYVKEEEKYHTNYKWEDII